jgi:hypothetical protein
VVKESLNVARLREQMGEGGVVCFAVMKIEVSYYDQYGEGRKITVEAELPRDNYEGGAPRFKAE